MHHVFALLVSSDNRAYEQHGGTCGTHDTCHHPTCGKKQGVHPRLGFDVACKVNTTRDDKQRQQQYNERDVVEKQLVFQLLCHTADNKTYSGRYTQNKRNQ